MKILVCVLGAILTPFLLIGVFAIEFLTIVAEFYDTAKGFVEDLLKNKCWW